MGPGRLTGMNARPHPLVNVVLATASMGPGRLTGMNATRQDRPPRRSGTARASMGPGRLTGMNAALRRLGYTGALPASMGPGRLTGMNVRTPGGK